MSQQVGFVFPDSHNDLRCDAVGRSTTAAVVKSTFLVIVADAVFTAIFYFTGMH